MGQRLTERAALMAYLRVWTFRPPPGREAEFAEAYSAAGQWARLFASADGFEGLTLLGPAEPGGSWMTLDRWASEDAFSAFEREHADAYAALDRSLEGLAGEERFVGAFEEVG